jgi:GDP-L-fucose synthase
MNMEKNSKIYIAGHKGLVGSSILRKLRELGYTNLIYRTREELNLLNQQKVLEFFEKEKPEFVFLAAAKVGGIIANSTYPADFIYQNTQISFNILHASHRFGVKKLLNLGSSCIYPRDSLQPMKEEYLLTGELEKTNEAYALAKISAIKYCQSLNSQYGTDFISAMPTNLYGPFDNFNLENSHVLPAMIRKFYEAKMDNNPFVELWGTGLVKREFLYVEDLSDALIYLMDAEKVPNLINIGSGEDISIVELAELIKEIVGYEGEINWDKTKPDGTPRKLLDVSLIQSLGWKHRTKLAEGIKKTYHWYLENQDILKK